MHENNSVSKPTLLQLRARHGITLQAIARASEMPFLLVWAMYVNRGMLKTEAERILFGLNRLCGTNYTLDDVDVLLEGGNL